MIARIINDKNGDMDCHAVPPPQCRAGGDSKREDLCQHDSERVNTTASGATSSGQLEAAGVSSSGRLVAAEDPASEQKVHLDPNTDGDQNIRKFDDLAKNFEPQTEKEHEFLQFKC